MNPTPPAGASPPVPDGPILVTGGAGYIGSHTVRLLRRSGVETIVADNLSTGHAASVDGDLERVNLGDRSALSDLFERRRPKAVMHFAARCYVGESVQDPALYYRENTMHTWHLLEAMRAIGCRDIVFSSSCATYGEPQTIPITEDHPQFPISPYGRTKLHMEHMMGDYSRAYGMRFAALRYFNAAGGSHDSTIGEVHEPETHLIPLALQVALGTRSEILVFGNDYKTPDGTCIRDYIHVEDLADAHLRAMCTLQGDTHRVMCNLGTGQGYSVLEVLDAARRVTGHPIPARVVDRRPGDPPRLLAGGARAALLLGWKPNRSDLDTILTDAWNFMRTHPEGYRTRS